MQYAIGDLRALIDDLEIEDLTAKDSGESIIKMIKSEYAEYLVAKKPVRFEEAFYDEKWCRERGERMIAYCSRRRTRFAKLKKEGWSVPDDLKGYMLYRDANLLKKLENW